MILQRLCEYYDRLAADPASQVAPPGFVWQAVAFEVVLDPDGTLFAVQDLRDVEGGRARPRRMLLPQGGKRASGVLPQFLWDKGEYLLGWVPPNGKADRIARCYAACRDLHLHTDIDDPSYTVLRRFYETWEPGSLPPESATLLQEMGGGFGVFKIRGEEGWLHERQAIRTYWSSRDEVSDEGSAVTCLVSGLQAPAARLHPVIKGIAGGKSSGCSIVAFNQESFKSYGHNQGANAPVSRMGAFKYTTALNHLLRPGSGRMLRVGDTTVVFWADAPISLDGVDGEDLFGWGLDPEGVEDTDLAESLGRAFQRVLAGTLPLPLEGTRFHLLGLAPNAARLSVRFWLEGTFGEFLQRVVQHQARLTLTGPPQARRHLPLWLIARQTVRDSKDIPPLLAGALARAVLSGGPYPQALYSAILRRIRVEGDVSHSKAAIIKAFLIRNHRKGVSPMLDPQRPEPAYHMGRLLAALEKTQEEALPGINATLKDRFFGAASSTPATVFPRLIRMSQHHMAKLEGGRKVHAEKRAQEIMSRIENFPAHLELVGQGLFAIGYYHQRQAFFTPKSKSSGDVDGVEARSDVPTHP